MVWRDVAPEPCTKKRSASDVWALQHDFMLSTSLHVG